MDNLTLVIPAKNEKESLPSVLEELKNFNVKILVILEERDIETINSIRNYDCKILKQSKTGYGNAIIEGINNTSTHFIILITLCGGINLI